MATVDLPRSRSGEMPRRRAVRVRPRHAFLYGSIGTLGILVLGLCLAPTIIARTPLRDSVLRSAVNLHGSASIGSATLGWFSSVTVHNIEIRDTDGEIVLAADEVRTEKTLIGLLLDFGHVGRIEIDKLTAHIVCSDKETNLEQVFAELLNSQSSDAKVAVEVKINDGTLIVDDLPGNRTYRVEQLAVDCAIADAEQPIIVSASGQLPDKSQAGHFKIDLRTQRSADGKNSVAGGKIDCQTTAVPLEIAEPIVRRFVEAGKLSGRLSTRLAGAWGPLAEGGEASVQGEALATNLNFSSAALGHDSLQLERVEVPCHLLQAGDKLQVEQLAVHCDLGDVTLSGSALMSDFSADDILAALLRENYKLQGTLDLVELARLLPETLRIREGTEITSGKVQLAMTSSQRDDGVAWNGHINASHLGAKADGRALVWENPLAIEFAARNTAKGVIVDRAECTSSFLQATASGSMETLNASANFDLARLLDEIRQFADLSDLKLAGRGEARLTLKRGANDQFSAIGQFQAKGFQFVPTAGGRTWKEDTVLARLDLGGKFEHQSLKQIDRGTLTVDIGTEKLSAQLREPLSDLKADWPLQCAWAGNLASWTPRLEACLGITGWELRGAGNLQAVVTCSSKAIDIDHAKAEFSQLQVWGHDWFVAEPNLSLAAEARYDLTQKRAEITTAKLVAGTTIATLSNAVLLSGEEGLKLDKGTAELGADLASLYRWRHNPRVAATMQVSGRLACTADLKYDSKATTARIDGTIDQLQLTDLTTVKAGTPASAWRERRITLAALGGYQPALEQLQLEKLQVASDALKCDASGRIPTSEQGGDVDVKGTIDYDWQQLAPLLRAYFGDSIKIAGRQSRRFALQGRLTGSPAVADSWKGVTGDAALGWTSIDLFGFQVGQGEIVANLANAQIRTQPIDFAISEGRFTLVPMARLVPAPAELFLPQGAVLTNIHLTPEMCARGLKFIAPVMAESTVADGAFSVSLDGGRLPLMDLKSGDVAGHIAIKAQVKPGPVANEFMMLINEIVGLIKQGAIPGLAQGGALMTIDTTDAEFRLVNRRVYHKNLKFTIGTVPISTYGSVGLDDESLALMASIPVEAKLFGKDLSFGALEGQALEVPLEGTLKKPKIDRNVIGKFASKAVENAARGVIVDEVNKQFERLFPQRAPVK